MLRINEILEKPVPWLDSDGSEVGVVMSSRLRLARNLKQYPFPNYARGDALREVVSETKSIFQSNSEFMNWDFSPFNLLSSSEKRLLLERRLISTDFTNRSDQAAIAVDENCVFSLMVNEEDHFRIQILDSEMDLELLWQSLVFIEEQLSKNFSFAFDDQFGFLTSNPLNSGCGLRISVLLHLPALRLTGKLAPILNHAIKYGMLVDGFYGKEKDATGSIYQIYNNLAVVWEVPELLQTCLKIAERVVDKEHEAQRKLQESKNRIDVEDKIFRSLGILERARRLKSQEFLEHYSNLKLGISLGIISEVDPDSLQELLLWIQPAHLQWYFGEEISTAERDAFRAEMVRSKLGL